MRETEKMERMGSGTLKKLKKNAHKNTSDQIAPEQREKVRS